MINAINVGNSILFRAFSENIDITPMKLQKLIYFTYRDYLKQTGKPLFREPFETWKYGPVLPSIYYEFKKYGSNTIREYGKENDGITILAVNEEQSPVFRSVLDHIWDNLKTMDGIYLSSLTHTSESAWSKAVNKNSYYLSNEDIKSEVVNFG